MHDGAVKYKQDFMDAAEVGDLGEFHQDASDWPVQFSPPPKGRKWKLGAKALLLDADFAVFYCLLDHCNPGDGRCDPGIQCIAHETGLSKSTVKRSIARLRERGLITIIRRGHNKGEKSVTNAYAINWQLLQGLDDAHTARRASWLKMRGKVRS